MARPEVRSAMLAVMTDPKRPSYARTGVEYESVRSMYNKRPEWREGGYKAPSLSSVVAHYGSWTKAALAHGLQLVAASDRPRKKPPTDARCEHCGGMFTSAGIVRHMDACPFRPAAIAVMRRLAESDIPGVAVEGVEYERRANAANRIDISAAPTYHIVREYYGSWGAAVERMGLITMEQYLDDQVDREREAAEEAQRLAEAREYSGLQVCRVHPARGGGWAFELR